MALSEKYLQRLRRRRTLERKQEEPSSAALLPQNKVWDDEQQKRQTELEQQKQAERESLERELAHLLRVLCFALPGLTSLKTHDVFPERLSEIGLPQWGHFI